MNEWWIRWWKLTWKDVDHRGSYTARRLNGGASEAGGYWHGSNKGAGNITDSKSDNLLSGIGAFAVGLGHRHRASNEEVCFRSVSQPSQWKRNREE